MPTTKQKSTNPTLFWSTNTTASRRSCEIVAIHSANVSNGCGSEIQFRIEHPSRNTTMNTQPLAAVIMAAGQGKRMKNPDRAKVMHSLGGIPLVEHVLRLARDIGATRVIVVVGHQRQSIIEYLDSVDPGVQFAVQEEQLGTGHAVQMAEPLLEDFTGDVIILSGDAPLTRRETMESALEKHRSSDATVTVLTAVLPDPTGYGRVIRDSDGNILKVVEHKDASEEERTVREINSGIYVFNSSELFGALRRIDNKNVQGEYYLPDVFEIFQQEGRTMVPHVVSNFDEIRGVNTVEQLAELEAIFLAS
jgi:UDP-N-acetylglucosamine diphosphorylase/glucosamine-1-phosphate N-acetyltransferase